VEGKTVVLCLGDYEYGTTVHYYLLVNLAVELMKIKRNTNHCRPRHGLCYEKVYESMFCLSAVYLFVYFGLVDRLNKMTFWRVNKQTFSQCILVVFLTSCWCLAMIRDWSYMKHCQVKED
jgi:hypothetical protein